MPDSPDIRAQFWQLLKRRRAIHIRTVYASVAFVIVELIINLPEPLSLHPKLATIMIIFLAVGFPMAKVLSWSMIFMNM